MSQTFRYALALLVGLALGGLWSWHLLEPASDTHDMIETVPMVIPGGLQLATKPKASTEAPKSLRQAPSGDRVVGYGQVFASLRSRNPAADGTPAATVASGGAVTPQKIRLDFKLLEDKKTGEPLVQVTSPDVDITDGYYHPNQSFSGPKPLPWLVALGGNKTARSLTVGRDVGPWFAGAQVLYTPQTKAALLAQVGFRFNSF